MVRDCCVIFINNLKIIKMKKSIYISIIAILFSFASIAQNSVGVTAGLNFATVSHGAVDMTEFSGIDYNTGFVYGIQYKRALDNNWSFVTGLNYARRGGESKLSQDIEIYNRQFEIGAKLEHRMNYIEIPMLFEYSFKNGSGVTPYIFAGPQMAYESSYEVLVRAHVIVDITLYKYNADLNNKMFNRFDISGVIGTGLSFPLAKGNLNIDARYIQGFSDILDDPILDLNLKHRNIRIGASYLYDF